MIRSFFYSLLLHVVIIAVLVFGLPQLDNDLQNTPAPVAFDVVSTETLTPKPAPRRVETKPQPKPDPTPVPQPEPASRPEKKDIPSQETQETQETQEVPEAQEPQKPEKPSEPVPEPSEKIPPLPKQESAPVLPIPLPEKKILEAKSPSPAPPKVVPVPQSKPSLKSPPSEAKKTEKKDTSPFMDVLKDLKKMKEKVHLKGQEDPNPSNEDGNTGKLGDQLTASEMDAVKAQLAKCWNVSSGAKDAKNLKVKIYLWLTPEGTVRKAKVLKDVFLHHDPFYKIAADRALNAVLDKACQPLPLPKNKFELWKEMTLEFDPKEMFGGNSDYEP